MKKQMLMMLLVVGMLIGTGGCAKQDKPKVENLAEIKIRVQTETPEESEIGLTTIRAGIRAEVEEDERKFEVRLDRIANETMWRGSPKQRETMRRMREAFKNDPELAREWGVGQ